jgi:hypothetical protein
MLILFLVLSSQAALTKQESSPECNVNYKQMLALDVNSFDQDTSRGWRALAQQARCKERAAEAIKLYRDFTISRLTSLYWHEGQLRAELGQDEQAIALMRRAKKPPLEFGQPQGDWNAYVDATIAFLKRDKVALLQARKVLAEFPLPDNYKYMDKDGVARQGRPPLWPYNLDVVDALIRCFDKPYREAYGSRKCRQTSND